MTNGEILHLAAQVSDMAELVAFLLNETDGEKHAQGAAILLSELAGRLSREVEVTLECERKAA